MSKKSGIKVEIDTKKLRKDLKRLLGQWDIKDWNSVLRAVARDFRKKKRGMFRQKNRGYFEPLSKKYARRKTKIYGFAYPMLVANGNLMRSIIHARNPDAITKITKGARDTTTLEIGSKNPLIKYHEAGTSKMPARPVLYWGPERKGFPDLGLPAYQTHPTPVSYTHLTLPTTPYV